jgi:hypothetical protein
MITLEVWLYGPLARYAPEPSTRSYAQIHISLPAGSTIGDLLSHLGIPREEKGITFVNGELSDMPGLGADLDRVLKDGDRIGLLHTGSMWPFQYRLLAKTSPQLEEALRGSEGKGIFHSSRAVSADSEGRC